MGFTFQDTRYNIAAGDYVILPNATLVSEFSDSEDFQGILMNLSDAFVSSITALLGIYHSCRIRS